MIVIRYTGRRRHAGYGAEAGPIEPSWVLAGALPAEVVRAHQAPFRRGSGH